ncbi:sugar isomerase domain-containing protein [Nitratireductor sp. ZSWI3]|uniref:sugar isomerase domain-containing protein n=1 Tax=Nitratireductor sp. ZSWI3 TaxID=2966359 RepID=UPI00215057E1|nr:sugar isomerase domain-containing protein [Nitratireductor sp. ZSWI3]MCR4264553.1 sugar isomerase domain-containing protein [Nitratireductor sp. ZSWI3]
MPEIDADALCSGYLAETQALMNRILIEERDPLDAAADRLAEQIEADRLVHVFGPGGHSNLASQEVFFRAGGLMHVSAILDEGTLLSNGALRSMAIERTPGYGRIVISNAQLGDRDLLILANAYGINAALIDAALEARSRDVFLIGVSSRQHAESTTADHPARHPGKHNLHDVVDIAIDTKVPVGDAVVKVPGMGESIAAISTFANAFALNCLVIRTVAKLMERGVEPPVWRSGNAPGGDEANSRFIARFRNRVRAL